MADNPYAAIAIKEDNPYAAIALGNRPVSPAPRPPEVTPSVGITARALGKAGVDLGKGALEEGAELSHGIGSMLNPAVQRFAPKSYANNFQTGLDTLKQWAQPEGTPMERGVQGFGKGVTQAASYLLPAKAETLAVEAAPRFLRPAARIATGALSGGTMNALNGGDFSTGAATGGTMGIAGEAGRALAPSLVRSAIPGNISRDTAKAILEHTGGVRPSTILGDTQSEIASAGKRLEASTKGNSLYTPIVSMGPARQAVEEATQSAPSEAAGLHGELSDLKDFLSKGRRTGQQIGDYVPAERALDLRRSLDEEKLGNRAWKSTAPDRALAATRSAYGGLTSALHEGAPGSIEADEMIHNLIPARTALRSLVKKDPDLAGDLLNRATARTGAMTGAAVGAAAGAHERGLPGLIFGGVTPLAIQETLQSPVAKMALARAGYSTLTPKIGRAVVTPAVQALMNNIRGKRREGQE